MKRFIHSVFAVTFSLALLLTSLGAYIAVVHMDASTKAFFNAVLHGGVADALSEEFQTEIWRQGSKVEIPFNVQYTRTVAVAIHFKDTFPPSGRVYSGRLLIRYYQGNRLVQSKTYCRTDTSSSTPGSMSETIILDTQVLPLHGGTPAHSVVIEVVEADSRFEAYKDSMRLQVTGFFSL